MNKHGIKADLNIYYQENFKRKNLPEPPSLEQIPKFNHINIPNLEKIDDVIFHHITIPRNPPPLEEIPPLTFKHINIPQKAPTFKHIRVRGRRKFAPKKKEPIRILNIDNDSGSIKNKLRNKPRFNYSGLQ